MGWFDIGEDLLGGDAPLDAYGGALDRIAKKFARSVRRKPSLREIVAAFDRRAPRGASATYDAMVRVLDQPAPETSSRPPKLLTGELLELPYDEGRAVVGLVLFGQDQKGGSYGPCVVALDLEVSDLDSLDRARTARWLTQPFHPGSGTSWKRLGRVALEPDVAFLPTFGWYRTPGRQGLSSQPFPGTERVIRDYFGAEVPCDPAHEARVVPASIGGRPTVAIRAARGLNRDLPWERYAPHPDADPTPLASLPPFVAARPPRARKKAPAREPDGALLAELDDALAKACEECRSAWHDAVERAPVREELAHALANVIVAAPDRYTCDPTRAESLPLRRPPQRSSEPSPRTLELRVAGERDQLIVREGQGRSWSAFPFREGGVLVIETIGAGDRALEALPEILGLWRAERGLASIEEDVVVRPMEWGAPIRTRA